MVSRIQLALVLVSLGFSASALANSECAAVFERPLADWLTLEVTANRLGAREVTGFQKVRAVWAALEMAEVVFTSPAVAEEFRGRLWTDSAVVFPVHPYAESKRVPFVSVKTRDTMDLHFTASRSMVGQTPSGRRFSLKLPTDRPHLSERQPHKARIADEMEQAIQNSKDLVVSLERTPSVRFFVLPDVGFVRERASGSGYLIRDVSALSRADRQYVPGFSLRWLWRPETGVTQVDFLRNVYVRPLARALQELSDVHGFLHLSPHAQNVLVEWGTDGRPTGRVVLRDLSEISRLVPGGRKALSDDVLGPIWREALDFLRGEGGPRPLSDVEIHALSQEFINTLTAP